MFHSRRIGFDSPLIDLLEEAAAAGKQVAVLVELKARFDERNYITWANRLEAAGVHVVYGLVNLKTHCKLCLVVRKEPDGIRRYAHVGTGNYNASTARVYTDLGLLTTRPRIVEDVANVFNLLTGYSGLTDYQELLVAPASPRRRLHELVKREAAHAAAGRPGRIVIKVNSITDPAIIEDLYRASQAGVRVDLIVRGICCLRPGVPGISDRISVRSVVGRFLEHSRIFSFVHWQCGPDGAQPRSPRRGCARCSIPISASTCATRCWARPCATRIARCSSAPTASTSSPRAATSSIVSTHRPFSSRAIRRSARASRIDDCGTEHWRITGD